MNRKPVVLVGVAAAAAIGLTGCGNTSSTHQTGGSAAPKASSSSSSGAPTSAGGSSSAKQVLSQAYAKTAAAGTAKLSLDSTTTVHGGRSTHATGDGVLQFKPPALEVKIKVMGRQVQTRVVDGKTYFNAGQGWTTSAAQARQMASVDPTQALGLLQGAVTDVTKTGRMNIRGTSTTGYEAKLDLHRAAAKAGSDARLKAGLQKADKAAGGKPIPIKLWVDDQGRVRREVVSTPLQVQGQKVTPRTQVDLYDFGTKVHVTAPKISD